MGMVHKWTHAQRAELSKQNKLGSGTISFCAWKLYIYIIMKYIAKHTQWLYKDGKICYYKNNHVRRESTWIDLHN